MINAHTHHRVTCGGCGTVISQCRCRSEAKNERYDVCSTCAESLSPEKLAALRVDIETGRFAAQVEKEKWTKGHTAEELGLVAGEMQFYNLVQGVPVPAEDPPPPGYNRGGTIRVRSIEPAQPIELLMTKGELVTVETPSQARARKDKP